MGVTLNPGGGSVTALVGALAASMGEMVLNYSIGKKDLAAHTPELQAALAELTESTAEKLKSLLGEAAYQNFSEGRTLDFFDQVRGSVKK